MKHSVASPLVLVPIVLSFVALAGCADGTGEGPAPRSDRHPVIVVTVDGLRADHLGCYGATGIETPAFDALAAESVRFQWAFAQAADPAVSMTSLLSGLYPTTAGVLEAGDRLPDEAETLAEAAAAAGVVTAAFLEGVPGGDDYGLAQGFGEFTMGAEPGQAARQWLSEHADDDFLMVFRGWSAGLDFGPGVTVDGVEAPEGFFERIQEVLASDFSDQPLELEPQDLDFAKLLYAARIRLIDRGLGEFIDELESSGLADRAVLVVAGTTGMDLEQHGATGSVSVHASVTRVPLLIRFPGGGTSGSFDEIVELVDLTPTLLELLAADAPPGVQGSSLTAIIHGSSKPPYVAFSESPRSGGQRAAALGGYRLVHSLEGDTVALFDLGSDPSELTDISAGEPKRVEVLRRHIEDWGKMVSAASLDPELRTEEELDDDTLERLKSLGYIQ